MSITTEDKMFAVEDNRDDEDMRDYYSKRGKIGTYVGKRAETLGLDISEIPILEIKNMKLIDESGIETTIYDSKWNEEIWKAV